MTKLANVTLLVAVGLTVGLGGCTRTPEQKEARFLANGKAQIEKKDYPRAIIEFKSAMRARPNRAEPYYQSGLAYLAMGDYQNAYQMFFHATELDPHHVGAQNKLAEIIGMSVSNGGDPTKLQDAQKRIQSVLAVVPNSSEALNALGLTEYFLGDKEDAVRQLEHALEESPQNVRVAWSLAKIKVAQKDFAGAEQIFRKVAADSPKSAEVQDALGRVLQVAGRSADAEAAYREAQSRDPQYVPALIDLAQLQYSLGKKEETEKTLATLSALPDKQLRPLHAAYIFALGRQDEAIKEFEKQAAEDPKDRDAFTRLTSAYFTSKRFSDAERVVKAALAKNPKDTAALLEQSKLYLLTLKLSEAEADLTRVLAAEPKSATAHYLLSKVLLARGQQLQSRQQLGDALESSPGLLAARLDWAASLTASGGAKEAVELLNHAPDNQGNLLPVIVARNWALLDLGDHAELRKRIDQGLAMYKSAPDLYLQDGLLKLEIRDFAGARKSLGSVLMANPADVRAVDAMGKTYLYEKKPVLALDTVRKYVAQRPDSGPMQAVLGDWLARVGRLDEARKAYAAALAADPTLTGVRLATVYMDIGERKFESARRTLDSLTSAPGTKVKVGVVLAQTEESAGNLTAAIADYRKVLEADPNNVTALNNLAYRLANDTDQFDEALKYAQQVTELDPNDPSVEDTIGWALYRKGLYRNALEHLQRAVSKQPTATEKYHLSMALVRAGDKEHGLSMLQQARKMDPSLPESAAAQAVINGQSN